MNLTWPLAITIIFVSLGLFGFVIAFYYLERKYPPKKEQKKILDPLVHSVIWTTLYILVIFFLEATGWIGQGIAKKLSFGAIILFFALYFINHKALEKIKPMEIKKLKSILWDFLWEDYHAKPHTGEAFGSPIPFHKIKNIDGNENDDFARVVYFLARTNIRGGLFYLVSMDLGNGYIVECTENPDYSVVTRIFGGKPAQQFDLQRKMLSQEMSLGYEQSQNVSYVDPYDKRIHTA